MIGNLTIKEIEEVLESQAIGRLGCSIDNQPYIVPITYAYDGKYIYGHSREGLKTQIMRQNPKVCFEVDKMRDMSNWKSVIIRGEFQELMGEKAREAMEFFMEALKPHTLSQTGIASTGINSFHQNEQSSTKTVIFRIKINEKSGRFERGKVQYFIG
jgi:nitroimidazol reductase NimA-like FMN-containing flavoprotein (pyridoxamine 5'-phosphate oxidase superfamily)